MGLMAPGQQPPMGGQGPAMGPPIPPPGGGGMPGGGMPPGGPPPPGQPPPDPTAQMGIEALNQLSPKTSNPTEAVQRIEQALDLAYQLVQSVIPMVGQWNSETAKDLHTTARALITAKNDMHSEMPPELPPDIAAMGQALGLPPGGPGMGPGGGGSAPGGMGL